MHPAPKTPTKAKSPLPQSVTSTVVKKSLQCSEPYAIPSQSNAEIPKNVTKKNMAGELAGQWIGPMPVKEFISTFLPTTSVIPDYNNDKRFFDVLKKQEYETDMYDPFINLVTTEAPNAIEGFQLVNTSQHVDRNVIRTMKNKPDVSCYKSACSIDPKRPTRYEDMELIFEFKPSREKADPFEDDPSKANPKDRFCFEPQADARTECRGQLACYARVWCSLQHRTHCFVVWMGDPHARIIRFDRSGAIVSAKFNYRTDGDLLLKFLWSFSHSNDVIRGLDETVTKASPDEKKTAHDKLYKWKPTRNRSVLKIQVSDPQPGPNGDKKRTRPFLVWGSLEDPRSVTGRATRGYPAWDPQEKRVVFLKDAWRSSEPSVEKEVDILRELNRAGCRNVPEVVCGDDLDQATVTKKYADKPWNIGPKAKHFVRRVHTRFVERKVGSHIKSKSQMDRMNAKTFLRIVFDAFIAHMDAYVKCRILHRDISAGNILVDEDGNGFLNDWDLSKHIDLDTGARQAFRSGTWQFMSSRILKNPEKPNTLQDDLESFFWVVLYHILRYMNHNQPEELQENMYIIFDSQTPTPLGQAPKGGLGKSALLEDGHPLTLDFEVTDNEPMTSFFWQVYFHLKAWKNHILAHPDAVRSYSIKNKVSWEVAKTQVPLNTTNLAMATHDVMLQLFTDAFAEESQWSAANLFVDRFPESQKRPRSEEESDGHEQDEGAVDEPESSDEADRPKKNKMSRKDDAAYKGRSGEASCPRVTRQTTKFQEMMQTED